MLASEASLNVPFAVLESDATSIQNGKFQRRSAVNRSHFKQLSLLAVLASGIIYATVPANGQPDEESPVQVRPSKENIVASELLGTWVVDDELSSRIGGRSDHLGKGPITFRDDAEAAARMLQFLNQTYAQLSGRKLDEKTQAILVSLRTVYLAGEVEFKGEKRDFALISIYGSPRLFFFDRKEDGESENVMLARDKDGDNDLLFLGGDFNNQSFGAFKRFVE